MNDEQVESIDPSRLEAIETLKRVVREALRDLQSGDLHPDALRARLERDLPATIAPPASTSIRHELEGAYEEILRRSGGGVSPVPLPSGWSEAVDGGLEPGVHVVVGPTKSGKSTLLSQVAMRAATAGHPVGLVPIELGKRQAATRLLAEAARVPWSDAYRGRLDDAQSRKLLDRVERVAALPIRFAPMNGPWRASELEPLAAELAGMSGGRTPLIVVDYLQLVKPEENTRADLRQCIGEAAYRAHHVADKHGVAVVLISSAARGHYKLLGGTEAESGLALSLDGTVDGEGVLMGVGKESGEIEYSVTTLNVIVRARCVDGKRRFALVVAANRFGAARWTPMVQDGWDIVEGCDEDRRQIVQALNPSPSQSSSSRGRPKKPDHHNDNTSSIAEEFQRDHAAVKMGRVPRTGAS